MSKKIVVLLLFVTIIISVLAMSYWGSNFPPSDFVAATELALFDMNNNYITEIVQNSYESRKVEIPYSNEKVTYDFRLAVLPSNATDLSISYTTLVGDKISKLNEVEISESKMKNINPEDTKDKGNYYFSIEFIDQDICRFCFEGNKAGTKIHQYLEIIWTGSKHQEDIDD